MCFASAVADTHSNSDRRFFIRDVFHGLARAASDAQQATEAAKQAILLPAVQTLRSVPRDEQSKSRPRPPAPNRVASVDELAEILGASSLANRVDQVVGCARTSIRLVTGERRKMPAR